MRIAVFTSGRQDWGILQPVRAALAASPSLSVALIAGGLHWRDRAALAELDGVRVDVAIDARTDGRDALDVARVAGATTARGAEALATLGAEAVVLVGDRTETLAMAVAATCLRLAVVHLHGGEDTLGAIDDACRHALTQLAHLHLVAHEAFARRVVAMGASPERVRVVGAPALDALHACAFAEATELAAALGRPRLGRPLVVLTHHPATLAADPAREIAAVIAGARAALAGRDDALVVMTAANNDLGGDRVNAALAAAAAADPRFVVAPTLGARRWWSLMRLADAMLGNSSSGILEAPSFALPVVDVGERQRGRLRVQATLAVAADADAVRDALARALAQPAATPRAPRATAYGDGRACPRIRDAVEALAREAPPERIARRGAVAAGGTP